LRYSYRPDEEVEKSEIEANFSRGLHFVGCWHTHPEDIASPSTVDTRNISDCVRRSHHTLAAMDLGSVPLALPSISGASSIGALTIRSNSDLGSEARNAPRCPWRCRVDNFGTSDVAAMNDVIDASQATLRFRPEQPVRVGDDPDPEGHRWRRPLVRVG
jgi:hypothetical protein